MVDKRFWVNSLGERGRPLPSSGWYERKKPRMLHTVIISLLIQNIKLKLKSDLVGSNVYCSHIHIFLWQMGKILKYLAFLLLLANWVFSINLILFCLLLSALFSSYSSSFSSFPSSFSYSSPPPITVFPSSSCQWLSMGSWSSPNIASVNSFSLNSASSVKYFSAVEYHLARPRHRCKKPFQSTLQWIDWQTNEWSPENH